MIAAPAKQLDLKSLDLRIKRARIWLLDNLPFYAQQCMKLANRFGKTVNAHTDGRMITWEPEYVNTLTDEEVRYILVHETLHCGLQHLWRLPADELGNIAGDYAIEKMLRGVPGISQPKGGLVCPTEFESMAEERTYAVLKSRKKDDGNGKDKDKQGSDQDGDSDDQDGQEGDQEGDGEGQYSDPSGSFTKPAESESDAKEDLQDEWKQHVMQAHFAAQLGFGQTPGGMLRRIEEMRHQKLDWKAELAEFVKDTVSQRNDWARAARRHAWQNVIYPRKRKDNVASIVLGRDTSGSIDEDACNVTTSMMMECCAEVGCKAILIDIDTDINRELVILPGEEWPKDAIGGGGTNFYPLFDRVKELIEDGEHIAGIIYWTDLQGQHSTTWDEPVPTLWITSGPYAKGMTAPFGRVVEVE